MGAEAPFQNSISQAMSRAGGRPSGFEYIRIILAILILYHHSFVQGGDDATPFRHYFGAPFIGELWVPMFFAVSGFLVAGSLDRTRLISTFLGLRALRIFPALWTDVIFAAVLLGPLVTTLPLSAYLSDPEFHKYWLNLIGEPHYYLPGVFKGNPDQDVNGQLWTIRWELFSYAALSACALLSLHKRPLLFLGVVIASHVAFPAISAALNREVPSYALTVVTCFLCGVFFHLFRERLALRFGWFLCALLLIVLLPFASDKAFLALPFPITYAAIYLGCQDPKRLWLVSSGDYSYGIFLYHRQVQQLLWLIFPIARTWYGSFALSLVFTFAIAYVSWHLIEKHALGLKSYLYAREKRKTAPTPLELAG